MHMTEVFAFINICLQKEERKTKAHHRQKAEKDGPGCFRQGWQAIRTRSSNPQHQRWPSSTHTHPKNINQMKKEGRMKEEGKGKEMTGRPLSGRRQQCALWQSISTFSPCLLSRMASVLMTSFSCKINFCPDGFKH